MSFIPNMRPGPAAPIDSFPYVDNLFDYKSFLVGSPDAIGSIPAAQRSRPIAVVGAGVSGMVAAYELLRAGAQNVDIYEASDSAHGRTWSRPFGIGPLQQYIAEMGAMRFPPSEVGLFHYLDKFRIPYSPNFPDPGNETTLTQIAYQGQVLEWKPGAAPPALFTKVNEAWGAFIDHGVSLADGTALAAPAAISVMLKSGQLSLAAAAWQAYIDVFENCSFYNGLVRVFAQSNAPGGKPWTVPGDFQLFGALGVGSGGFGPLYPVGFLEIVRLFVNELETAQQFVPGGIQSLVNVLGAQTFAGRSISQRIQFNASVVAISKNPSPNAPVVLAFAAGAMKSYDRVIVATSNRAGQIAGLAAVANGNGPLTAQQCTALDDVHMVSSSKVFVLTASKFWQKDPTLPGNIQTDTLTRGTYCLDYSPGDPNGRGVVLLSYTWEDDSTKQMGLSTKRERVQRLVRDIATVNPRFAEYVVPLDNDYDNNTVMVDWQTQPGYYGAFKLSLPGADGLSQQLFFQFQAAKSPSTDRYVYLAGDSYSFTGGWVEGAIQTGLNAVCAVIRSYGGSFTFEANPIDDMPATAYSYDTTKG